MCKYPLPACIRGKFCASALSHAHQQAVVAEAAAAANGVGRHCSVNGFDAIKRRKENICAIECLPLGKPQF